MSACLREGDSMAFVSCTIKCSHGLYLQLTHHPCKRRASKLCDRLLLPRDCFLLYMQQKSSCLCQITCSVLCNSTSKPIPILVVEMTVGLNLNMRSPAPFVNNLVLKNGSQLFMVVCICIIKPCSTPSCLVKNSTRHC